MRVACGLAGVVLASAAVVIAAAFVGDGAFDSELPVLSVIRWLTALEMLLVPAWVGAVLARPGLPRRRPGEPGVPLVSRLVWAMAAVVVVAAASLALAAAGGGGAGGVLEVQAVAAGFVILLAGTAAVLARAAGPLAAQMLTTMLGWLLLAGIILAAPLVELTHGPLQAEIVRLVAHANPLLVAERELGLDWLHQGLTYRLTPLGESYGYLLGDLAWWKTALASMFVGSGLLVFGATGRR